MSVNDGGAAILCPSCGCAVGVTSQNIDLRTWFAGQCLHADWSSGMSLADIAAHCYKQADAMLKEREKP